MLMWSGAVVALIGFASLVTGPAWPLGVHKEDLFDAIGGWLTRLGLATAFVGSAAHLAIR
jgi:hypothetical protein